MTEVCPYICNNKTDYGYCKTSACINPTHRAPTFTSYESYDPIEIARQYAPKFDKPVVDMVEVVRKPIKGYEGSYVVDQFGRVFALDRTVRVDDNGRVYDKPIRARQLKQGVHSKGYKVVTLTKDGVSKTAFVHRLVAEAFIPNENNLPYINHKDEDKTNNFVENLEWCTAQYNSTYGKAKQKQAAKLTGRPLTEEHKRKIAEGVKRFYESRAEREGEQTEYHIENDGTYEGGE